MTRPSTRPRGTADAFRAGMRRAGVPEIRHDERTVPGTVPARTPGTRLHRVKIMIGQRRRTKEEAAATFADAPWARRARYVRMSGGWYCWEVPEDAT